ncbi:sulfotransferase, partial [Candidatus Bipolaricaulota bacterium]|nr:sulfotransferase [Candidatus Bipolaricaulota bacterium]
IHRNPYEVFLSTRHMHRTVLPRSRLQSIVPAKLEAHVLQFYDQLMHRFLADRSLIPPDNLIEVRFEDLETSPLDQLRRLYDGLRLPGFATAEPGFRSYLESVSGYRKNEYALDGDTIEKVNAQWPFAFEAWGYERLERPPQSAWVQRPVGAA